MGSNQDFRNLQAKFQASQPELGEPLRKPPKPEFNKLKKFPQTGLGEQPKKASQPELSAGSLKPLQLQLADLPKKPPQPKKASQPELSTGSLKPLQLQLADLPKKPPQPGVLKKLPQPEFTDLGKKPIQAELPRKPRHPELTGLKKPSQAEVADLRKPPQPQIASLPKPPQPDISAFPKNITQPEFNENFRKPSRPQATGCPKSPKQPMFCEVPQTPPRKPAACSAQSHSPPPDFNAFPRKHPQLQPSDLTRTSSEPEVCKVPQKTQQPDPNVLSKRPSQPELGDLPRTSSEPEFNSLPRKFLQPQHGKFFPPEFPKGLPRKPKLPGSVSECSLPSATVGSSPQVPLSSGLTVPGRPRWRSEDFQVQHPPRRRPLPSASSLGHPPAKPPLPPVPINIQSFRRAPATATGELGNPEEIYELYDAMEATDDSTLSPRGRDEMQSTQHATRRPQEEPELRKATQLQQLPATDPKLLKQTRKAEKAEREFRKKFKFEGEIVIHTKMMIDPNAKTRRGGGKHLGIRRGEILEVIEFTSKEEMLCRDPKGKYGYVPRAALLPLETEVYDDVSFGDPLDMQPFPQ